MYGKKQKRLSALLGTFLLAALPAGQSAQAFLLPQVTQEMEDPSYWTDPAGEVLAGAEEITAVNAAVMERVECCMIDLKRDYAPYDGRALRQELLEMAKRDLGGFMGSGYYNAEGGPVSLESAEEIWANIEASPAGAPEEVRYGICVEVADVRAVPTAMIITDSPGDNDFDVLQLSNLRVNEPVVIKAETGDGAWYYCDSVCVSGWVPAERIAVCSDREEWISAWCIPEDELLVVAQSRLYLDRANVNAASSERMLTMGTTLRIVDGDEYDSALVNRAPCHNHAVWLPVRCEDGSYSKTIALIPTRHEVSMGYLPLTEENILRVSLTALGDAYGWGGMLGVPDCSLFVRNVYKCFGLEIPRNTTWQSAMPTGKVSLEGMDQDSKASLLETLPSGTILFFNGHEMLYLGESGGKHYVLSSVSSIMAPEGGYIMRLRCVVINTLEDTMRASGRSWLEDLNLAVVPYDMQIGESEADSAA